MNSDIISHNRKSSNIIDTSKNSYNSKNNIDNRNSEPKFYEQYVKKKEMQLLLNEQKRKENEQKELY